MSLRYTIGELARSGGVQISTVRFYERKGLLRPDGRTDGNYRFYGAAGLARLRFIRSALDGGFSLADIRLLLDLREGVSAPRPRVQKLIRQRIVDIERRMEQLHGLRDFLKASLKSCESSTSTKECPVIQSLGLASRSPRPRTRRSRPGNSRNSP